MPRKLHASLHLAYDIISLLALQARLPVVSPPLDLPVYQIQGGSCRDILHDSVDLMIQFKGGLNGMPTEKLWR